MLQIFLFHLKLIAAGRRVGPFPKPRDSAHVREGRDPEEPRVFINSTRCMVIRRRIFQQLERVAECTGAAGNAINITTSCPGPTASTVPTTGTRGQKRSRTASNEAEEAAFARTRRDAAAYAPRRVGNNGVEIEPLGLESSALVCLQT